MKHVGALLTVAFSSLGCTSVPRAVHYEYSFHPTAEIYFDWVCEGVYRTDFRDRDRDAGVGWLVHGELGADKFTDALAKINLRINRFARDGWEVQSFTRDGLLLRRALSLESPAAIDQQRSETSPGLLSTVAPGE